jgi:hypothetical protein
MSNAAAVIDPKKQRPGDSRTKFIKALSVLAAKGNDREVQDLVTMFNLGNLMLTDASIQATKNASERSQVDMFLNTDEREVGINSVAKSMLPKGAYLLVESVTILGAHLPTTGANAVQPLARGSQEEKEALKKSKFVSLNAAGNQSALCIVANGELKIRVRNKDVVSGLALHRFVQDNNNGTPTGTLLLDTPFFIRAQEPIEVILELPTATRVNTLVRVLLNGTTTVPA